MPSINSAYIIYNGNLGLDKNYTRAEEWLEKAAKQGHPEAQHLLLTAYNTITFS
ncbi:hypothetical protein [Acinetobacter sp.]|uniref:hypothetical protein n=1 Tax=Acinetobacter sp. TaxID=472 RepID=UPI0026478B99|nr:hypothetical protein [Acinetobacter sp.]MDN5512687.1 hypothetical protein [Acinetobacter sp.]MDN5525416.1 hypothetical protein [Acinetobacter sp.]